MLQVRLVKINLYFSRNAGEVDNKSQSTSIFRDKTNSRFIERNKERDDKGGDKRQEMAALLRLAGVL